MTVSANRVASQAPAETRDPQARHDLDFVDPLEPLAAVELLRRLVGAAGLDDSAVGLRLGRERGPNQCGADSSSKAVRIDHEPMQIEDAGVDTPRDRPDEGPPR